MTRTTCHRIVMMIVLLLLVRTADAQWYGQTIYAEEPASAAVRKAVDDLGAQLGKASGKKFSVRSFRNDIQAPGIYVLKDRPQLSSLHSVDLKQQSIEAAWLSGDKDRLFVVADHDKGLVNGIYTYLHTLGFRWYFPGDLWAFVPARRDVLYSGSKLMTPSFQCRTFAGTGGLAPVVGVDPDLRLPALWKDWHERNRLGGAFIPSGHYGEEFNTKYKAELQRHPEYMALNGGKRGPYSEIVKWCISNKGFRALFVEDRLRYLREALAASAPGSTEQILISVEPADGGTVCECSECRKIGSYSDCIFGLANEVAREAAKISNRARANMYAYNVHAALPKGTIASNLYVQIIPYAFQNFSTPEGMIAAWKKKSDQLLIYDYYALTDWHKDLPLSDRWAPREFASRMKYWYNNNIRGITMESSYSIAAAGEGLYYLARLGWDISEQPEAISEEFYNNMFGGVQAPMKDFFGKLHKGYNVNTDIPLLLESLQQAGDRAGSEAVRQRIDQLKAYVHFLVLDQQLATSRDEPSWINYMKYVWQLYPTALVHSSRLAQLQNQHALDDKYPQYSYYTLLDPNKPLRQPGLSAADMQRNFQADRQAYAGLAQSVTRPAAAAYRIDYEKGQASEAPAEMMLRNAPEFVIRGDASGNCTFSLKNNVASGNERQDISVFVVGKNKDTVFKQVLNADKDWRKVTVPRLSNKEDYRLLLVNTSWFWVQVPPTQYFGITSIPTYSVMGRLNFYVPSGTRSLLFTAQEGGPPVFTAPDGKKMSSEKVKDNTYKVTVPAAYSGKWWTLSDSQYKLLEFYFKPSLFFTHTHYSVTPR